MTAVAIEAEHLSKRFGSKLAVNDLSLSVARGEILGFLGPNGAGKTTTLRLLTGMLRPDSGRARVAGFDAVEQPLEVKRRIGVVPESGALYAHLTAAEYLQLVATLHHLPYPIAEERAARLLELFDLTAVRHQRMTGYSKGMKKKALLAAALLPNPEVLFLDEPLDGLDANAARLVKDLLRQSAAEDKTIFFCSHILEVVERLCTRIVIIHEGKKLIEGPVPSILAELKADSLEEAFGRLTGAHESGQIAQEILRALERS